MNCCRQDNNTEDSCESDVGHNGDDDNGPDETDEDEEDLERQITPPPPLELRRPPVRFPKFRDISGLREPVYADPKVRSTTAAGQSPTEVPIIPSSIPLPEVCGPNATVHWPLTPEDKPAVAKTVTGINSKANPPTAVDETQDNSEELEDT